ncbi:MAG TPA: hypothetical protein VGC55_01675 [Dokdonella sp.]
MKSLCLLLAMMIAIPAGAAVARENYVEPDKNADSREKLADVAANVRKEMQQGGRFQYVNPRERDTVNAKFSEMDALFGRSGSVAQMNDDQKTRLFNAQEVINSILTDRDSDRLICKNEPIMGSHVRSKTCRTYGDEQARNSVSAKDMLDREAVVCKHNGPFCPNVR